MGSGEAIEQATTELIVLGIPAALGGWLPEHASAIEGMARTPEGLRERGLLTRIDDMNPRLAVVDRGDMAFSPAFRADDDPHAKNRDLMIDMFSRARQRVSDELLAAGDAARILVLGGECTLHPAAIGGIKAARPGKQLALLWFDAHGDFHTPDTTPSGNVWGMPFAIACGRGDDAMIEACGGIGVHEDAAALIGGQSREENEAWAMTTARVAHFGSGMIQTEAGMAALRAWLAVVARSVDGFYIAFDFDALDAADNWAVVLQEPGGLSLEAALAAVRAVASAGPVVGFGATTISLGQGDVDRTVAAVGELVACAFA